MFPLKIICFCPGRDVHQTANLNHQAQILFFRLTWCISTESTLFYLPSGQIPLQTSKEIRYLNTRDIYKRNTLKNHNWKTCANLVVVPLSKFYKYIILYLFCQFYHNFEIVIVFYYLSRYIFMSYITADPVFKIAKNDCSNSHLKINPNLQIKTFSFSWIHLKQKASIC